MTLRPLVLLVLSAVTLFAWYGAAAPRLDDTIDIGDTDVEAVVAFNEAVRGQSLTPAGRDSAVEAYVEDEILVREAYRTGVDRGDPRTRTLLADAARNELQPDTTDPQPTEAQLRTYFTEHRGRYAIRAVVTFHQVFFPFGWLDDSGEAAVLDSLARGIDPYALVAGVEFANVQVVRDVARTSLSRSFGRRFAEQLFATDDTTWHALRSQQGVHFVRVRGRRPRRERNFDEVRAYVEGDWYLSLFVDRSREALRRIETRYQVIVGGERE